MVMVIGLNDFKGGGGAIINKLCKFIGYNESELKGSSKINFKKSK
jgi:hypothetical protein